MASSPIQALKTLGSIGDIDWLPIGSARNLVSAPRGIIKQPIQNFHSQVAKRAVMNAAMRRLYAANPDAVNKSMSTQKAV